MGIESRRHTPETPDERIRITLDTPRRGRDNPYHPFDNAAQKWWWHFDYARRTGGDDINEITRAWLSLSYLDRQAWWADAKLRPLPDHL